MVDRDGVEKCSQLSLLFQSSYYHGSKLLFVYSRVDVLFLKFVQNDQWSPSKFFTFFGQKSILKFEFWASKKVGLFRWILWNTWQCSAKGKFCSLERKFYWINTKCGYLWVQSNMLQIYNHAPLCHIQHGRTRQKRQSVFRFFITSVDSW